MQFKKGTRLQRAPQPFVRKPLSLSKAWQFLEVSTTHWPHLKRWGERTPAMGCCVPIMLKVLLLYVPTPGVPACAKDSRMLASA